MTSPNQNASLLKHQPTYVFGRLGILIAVFSIGLAIWDLSTWLNVGSEVQAWSETKKLNTVEAYEQLLQHKINPEIRRQANEKLEQARFNLKESAWIATQKEDTEEAYLSFLERYPNSEFSNEARDSVELLAWEKAKASNTEGALHKFVDRFPKSRQIKYAKSLAEEIAWQSINPNNEDSLEKFVAAYPESKRRLKILQNLIKSNPYRQFIYWLPYKNGNRLTHNEKSLLSSVLSLVDKKEAMGAGSVEVDTISLEKASKKRAIPIVGAITDSSIKKVSAIFRAGGEVFIVSVGGQKTAASGRLREAAEFLLDLRAIRKRNNAFDGAIFALPTPVPGDSRDWYNHLFSALAESQGVKRGDIVIMFISNRVLPVRSNDDADHDRMFSENALSLKQIDVMEKLPLVSIKKAIANRKIRSYLIGYSLAKTLLVQPINYISNNRKSDFSNDISGNISILEKHYKTKNSWKKPKHDKLSRLLFSFALEYCKIAKIDVLIDELDQGLKDGAESAHFPVMPFRIDMIALAQGMLGSTVKQ